jgi:hypothetical protein
MRLYLSALSLFIFSNIIVGYAQRSDFAGISFAKADSVAAHYTPHSLSNIPSLTYALTNSLPSEVEKLRAIYKWVCSNIENDYDLYLTNKAKRESLKTEAEKREWNSELSKKTFQRLVDDKMTVCTGYAYLIREMSSLAGLKTVIVDGYGRNINANIEGEGVPNHSWNAVQLNGKWYLCDATWSSGAFDVDQDKFIQKYIDEYFLAEPETFIRNHYPLDHKWILLEDYPSLHSFLYAPIVYPAIYRFDVQFLFPETFNCVISKKESFVIRLALTQKINSGNIKIGVQSGSRFTLYTPNVTTQANGALVIEHPFSNRGTFIVHLMADGEYICTYKVQVK